MTAGPISNAVFAEQISPKERLDEIAEILAAGLTRLRSRQSSSQSADFGDSSLDCAAAQSGHPEAGVAAGSCLFGRDWRS
jgi:hypothetical protein